MAVDLRQTHFRFGVLELSELKHGWIANEDTNISIFSGSSFTLRFTAQETGGTATVDTDFQFEYNKNGAGWNSITTTSSVVKAISTTFLVNGGNCTKRLSGTGTFEGTAAGVTEDGTSGGTACDIAANGNTETECSLQIVDADVADGDTIQFRITSPDYTITHDIIPTLTIAKVGIQASKANLYTVVTNPLENISVSKALSYTVLIDIGLSINVSKINAYTVLAEQFEADAATTLDAILVSRLNTGDCSRALFGGPCVIFKTDDANLGDCERALFGGPLIVAYKTEPEFTQVTYTKGVLLNANLAKSYSLSASLDAILDLGIQTYSIETNLNSYLQKAGISQNISLDSYISKVCSEYANLDARLLKELSLTLGVDALLIAEVLKELSLDGYLQKSSEVTAQLEAYLKQENISKIVNLDGLLIRAIVVGLSAIIANENGITVDFEMSAWIKKQGEEIETELTAYLKQESAAEISLLLQGYLKKLANAVSTSVDGYLQKQDRTKQVLLNSYLAQSGANSNVVLDSLLIRGLPPHSIILDAYLRKNKSVPSITMDAYLMSSNVSSNLLLVL